MRHLDISHTLLYFAVISGHYNDTSDHFLISIKQVYLSKSYLVIAWPWSGDVRPHLVTWSWTLCWRIWSPDWAREERTSLGERRGDSGVSQQQQQQPGTGRLRSCLSSQGQTSHKCESESGFAFCDYCDGDDGEMESLF